MCGIAGIINFNAERADQAGIRKMTDALRHRGPDGEGHWFSSEGDVALGHRRLAIIDLSEAAAQPMIYADRFVITLNGEIYNYPELKEVLRKKGYVFHTQSDTEVLLAMYMEYGEHCLTYLDGMFAFCIYDQLEKTVFCARDRFGEKPFYYHIDSKGNFAFASEVKALFASGIPFRENMKMIYYFIAYQVMENPFDKKETFFKDIFSLPPAHYLLFNHQGRMNLSSFWELPQETGTGIPSPEEAAEEIRSLLKLSVSRRLRSDVPVGSSLSGGIDSSTIVYSIHTLLEGKEKIPQSTFTARFDDPEKDEGRYMKILTDELPVNQHETWVTGNSFLTDFDKIIWHQEEPMGGASPVAQWEVMKLAASHNVTVLLDGQGADEVFAGYPHFFRPYFSELFRHDRKKFAEEKKAFEQLHLTRYQTGLSFYLEASIPEFLRILGDQGRKIRTPSYLKDFHPDFLEAYHQTPPPFKTFPDLNQTLRYATTVYGLGKLLKLADRNAMAFAREVRLPFLYHPLVEFLFRLPASYKLSAGWTKWILRTAFDKLLPDEIIWRKTKLGYEPPMEKWMSHPLVREKVKEAIDMLTKEKILLHPARDKDWFYWNACNFLYVFKNQVNTMNHG